MTSLNAKRAAIHELETPKDVVSLWSPRDHCLVTEVTPKTRQNMLSVIRRYEVRSSGLKNLRNYCSLPVNKAIWFDESVEAKCNVFES